MHFEKPPWKVPALLAVACAILLAGCAAEETAPPRVFFIGPADGATVTSPATLTFGAENFIIEPVGEGEIHEGAGHHHLGIGTECLPAGEIIPQAAPWVHFGDGSSEFTLQLEPGTYRLCLQPGDGEHRTLEGEGMSAAITITAVESEG